MIRFLLKNLSKYGMSWLPERGVGMRWFKKWRDGLDFERDYMRLTRVLFRGRGDGRGNHSFGDHTSCPNTGLPYGYLHKVSS